MRFILPVILIGVSITAFFMFSNPIYGEIAQLRVQTASYDEALNNSKMLENERDKLTAKYNSINPEDLVKLEKFLPENIDNIRLILEIEQLASPYGMTLKDVKYDTTTTSDTAANSGVVGGRQGAAATQSTNKGYGTWNLEFSTIGAYDNFLRFIDNLENNLRIVDISSVQFSSSSDLRQSSVPSDIYKYDFGIKTYWLKN